MKTPLFKRIAVGGIELLIRPNSSDGTVALEVLGRMPYRRASIGFDVQPGERWLDLGANVGAFAVYCASRDAVADCYEPDPETFKVLVRNVDPGRCVNAAVTATRSATVEFWTRRNRKGRFSAPGLSYHKGSVFPNGVREPPVVVCNVFVGDIPGPYDGIKLDVEGAEGPIIDCGRLPECDKLVMEYHSTIDKSVENLSRRLAWLKSVFEVVQYRNEFDRMIAGGGSRRTFMDRLVWCMKRK